MDVTDDRLVVTLTGLAAERARQHAEKHGGAAAAVRRGLALLELVEELDGRGERLMVEEIATGKIERLRLVWPM